MTCEAESRGTHSVIIHDGFPIYADDVGDDWYADGDDSRSMLLDDECSADV